MKFPATSLGWLLPLLLCACMHKTTQSQVQPLAPPIEDPPPPKADSAAANLPQPIILLPKPAPPQTVVLKPEQPKTVQKKKKTSSKPAPPPPSQSTTDSASAGPPPEVPAIGNLTSGEPDDQKNKAASSIADVEKGLAQITRKLSEQEEKTSTQIKEYMKQARTALDSGDVEGANTLVLKAKVLLSELTP